MIEMLYIMVFHNNTRCCPVNAVFNPDCVVWCKLNNLMSLFFYVPVHSSLCSEAKDGIMRAGQLLRVCGASRSRHYPGWQGGQREARLRGPLSVPPARVGVARTAATRRQLPVASAVLLGC